MPKLRSLSFPFQIWSSYSNAKTETEASSRQAQLRLSNAERSSASEATATPFEFPRDGQPDLIKDKTLALHPRFSVCRPTLLWRVVYYHIRPGVQGQRYGSQSCQFDRRLCLYHRKHYPKNEKFLEKKKKFVTYWALAPTKSPWQNTGLSRIITQVWTVETGVLIPAFRRVPI